MKGSTFRRCGCRTPDGKPDNACPRLGRERGHGSWYFRADVGADGTGRRRERRKGGFTTEKAAQAALSAVLHSVNTHEYRHDDRQTVGGFLPEWLTRKAANGLRPATVAMYGRYIEQDLVPALGRLRLGDLRPTHVEGFLDGLGAAGRGATTVRRIHATLRSALTDAKRLRLVTYNAATDAAPPAVRPPEVHPWEAEELADFLDHAESHRLGALFEVLAFTGLRRGEVCGLRWSDIDLTRGVITVREQLVEVDGRIIPGAPKTQSGVRVVEIGERVIEALRGRQLAQDIDRAEWRDGYAVGGRVFTREDGTDLFPSYVTKLFGKLVKAAGVRPVRLHDLRHGAASLMLAQGIPMTVVSKRLGHSSVGITSDIYSHLLEGVGASAAAATEAAVRPRATTRAT